MLFLCVFPSLLKKKTKFWGSTVDTDTDVIDVADGVGSCICAS